MTLSIPRDSSKALTACAGAQERASSHPVPVPAGLL